MADYSELLARLIGPLPSKTAAVGMEPLGAETVMAGASYIGVISERAECAAAIRALIAERDAAVLAEREACANVCHESANLLCTAGWPHDRHIAAALRAASRAITARPNG